MVEPTIDGPSFANLIVINAVQDLFNLAEIDAIDNTR